jgi:8-oxo-dGTP diphosphatase
VPRLAAAIVIHRDHVLIVRRSISEGFLPGRWGVPCGKIDDGESAPQAVLRELHEETGLSGSVTGWVGQSSFPSIWRGQRVTNIQDNYLINVSPTQLIDPDGMPAVTLPKRDQVAKWVPATEIGSADLDPHNLRTIRQGLVRHSASVA